MQPGAKPKQPSRAELQARKRALDAELGKRERLPKAVAAYEATLTNPKQRAAVMSTARRVTVWAGRRSGKTYGPGVGRAIRAALAHPGATVPVAERTLTCASARVFWKALMDIDAKHNLEAKFHHALFSCTLKNRSTIVLAGADTIESCDKLRGDAYPEFIIDEAGTLRPHVLRYLVQDVAGPALLDYRGTLTMLGTPVPRFEDNPFWEACCADNLSSEWDRHHWTFLDNDALPLNCEHMPADERRALRMAEFELECRRLGLSPDDPFIQREWLGMWVRDANGLVYALQPSNHAGVQPPDLSRGAWKYGLGIDLGYDDPTSFVVFAWRKGDPRVWVLESFQEANLVPTAVAARVERLRARYRFAFIVADSGGYGKGPVEEMRALGIPVEAAAKRGKEGHIWAANGDLRTNSVQIVEASNRELIADLYGLRKDEDGKEDERDANHLPDGFLYGLMRIRGRLADRMEPPESDLQRRQREEAEMEELEEERVRRQGEHRPAADTLDAALEQL